MIGTDLTPKHVEIMKEKLQTHPNVKMTIQEADATNLAAFHDEVFDNVICLGPMYHLITIEQQEKCISECLRVLKPGGLLAVAYISRYSVFPYLVKGDRKFLTESWVNRMRAILHPKTRIVSGQMLISIRPMILFLSWSNLIRKSSSI